MARLNCLSKKQVEGADPPPLPSRPVYALPHRPRAENIKHNIQANVFRFNHRPVNQQPRQDRAPKAMNNAVHGGGADGGNSQAMNRSYIEISDNEDLDRKSVV